MATFNTHVKENQKIFSLQHFNKQKISWQMERESSPTCDQPHGRFLLFGRQVLLHEHSG